MRHSLLVRAQIEEAAHVPPGNHQRVPGRHRVGVAHRNGQRVGVHDALGGEGAEGAGGHGCFGIG